MSLKEILRNRWFKLGFWALLYSKRKRRSLVIAFDGVLFAGHIAVAVLLKAWYAILSPAAILLIVMIVVSDVIEKH